jgi:hypothetical protein
MTFWAGGQCNYPMIGGPKPTSATGSLALFFGLAARGQIGYIIIHVNFKIPKQLGR